MFLLQIGDKLLIQCHNNNLIIKLKNSAVYDKTMPEYQYTCITIHCLSLGIILHLDKEYVSVKFFNLFSLLNTLQFDVNGDGMLDLLFTKSSGELLFYDSDGSLFKQHRYQVC